MWLFTPFGFFSVVAHRDDSDLLCVRARARNDLLALHSRMPGSARVSPDVIRTPDADYPYRLIVAREDLDLVMTAFLRDELTYDNFKGACEPVGVLQWRELHAVWDVMHGHEDSEARPVRDIDRHELRLQELLAELPAPVRVPRARRVKARRA